MCAWGGGWRSVICAGDLDITGERLSWDQAVDQLWPRWSEQTNNK